MIGTVVAPSTAYRYWTLRLGSRAVLGRATVAEVESIRPALERMGWTVAEATPLEVAMLRASELFAKSGRTLAPRFTPLVAP